MKTKDNIKTARKDVETLKKQVEKKIKENDKNIQKIFCDELCSKMEDVINKNKQ